MRYWPTMKEKEATLSGGSDLSSGLKGKFKSKIMSFAYGWVRFPLTRVPTKWYPFDFASGYAHGYVSVSCGQYLLQVFNYTIITTSQRKIVCMEVKGTT